MEYRKFTYNSGGFTIVELLVSITIIALLSTIGMTGYQSVSRGGRDALRKSDLEEIRSSLEIYKSTIGSYPTSTSCSPDNLEPEYIQKLPLDPKNPTFSYCYIQSTNLTYELCAHLENGDTTTDNCEGGNNCGGNCNYSIHNP